MSSPAVLELLESARRSVFWRNGRRKIYSIRCQYLAAGSGDGLFHNIGRGTCNALVALTMVVGTYIETCVVFSVVPANQLFVGLRKGRGVRVAWASVISLFFCICASSQLREMTACASSSSREAVALISGGDDAGQIIFYMDDVDAGELSILNDDFEHPENAGLPCAPNGN